LTHTADGEEEAQDEVGASGEASNRRRSLLPSSLFVKATPLALPTCAVAEGIAQVTSGVYETMAFMDGSFQAAEITAIYKRTKTLFDQASNTGDQMNTLSQTVNAIGLKLLQVERELLDNQQIIIQLLNTPLGQRPNFPKTVSGLLITGQMTKSGSTIDVRGWVSRPLPC